MSPSLSRKESASSLIDEVIANNTKSLKAGVKKIQVLYEGALIHPIYQLRVECENGDELELRGKFNIFRRAKMSCKRAGIEVPETFPVTMAKSKFGVGLTVDQLEARRQGLEACFLEMYINIFPTLVPEQQRLLASLLKQSNTDNTTTTISNEEQAVSGKSEEDNFTPKQILANCEARVEITVDTNHKHPLYIMRLTIKHGRRGAKTLLALHPIKFAEFVAINDMIMKFESKPVLPDFPPRYVTSKLGLKLSDKVIEERRSRLETYFAVLFHLFHDLKEEEQDALLNVLPFDIIPIDKGTTPRTDTTNNMSEHQKNVQQDDDHPVMPVITISTEIKGGADSIKKSNNPASSKNDNTNEQPPTRLRSSIAACSESLSFLDACRLTRMLGGGSSEFRMVYFILHSVFHLPDPDYGYASAHPDWFVTAKLVGNEDDEDDDDDDDNDEKVNEQSAMAHLVAEKRKKQELLNREQYSSHLKSESEDIHWDPPISMVFVANAQQELDEQRLLLCLYDRNLGGDDSMDSLVAYGVISNLKELHSSARQNDVSFTRLEVSLVDVDNRVTGAVIAGDIAVMTPHEAREYANVISTAVVKFEQRYILPSQNFFDWCICSEFSGREPHTAWRTLGFLKAHDYCNPFEEEPESVDDLDTLAKDLDQASPIGPREQIIEPWGQNHNPDEEDENGFQYASSLSANATWSMYPPCVQGCIRRSVWYRTTEIFPEASDEQLLNKVEEVRSALRRSTYHPLRASRLIRFNESQRRLVHDSQLHRGLNKAIHNALLHQALSFGDIKTDDVVLDLSTLSGEDGFIARYALNTFSIDKALLAVLPANNNDDEEEPEDSLARRLSNDMPVDELKQLINEYGSDKVSLVTVDESITNMSDTFQAATLVIAHLSANALRVIEPHLIKFLKANPARRLLCLGWNLATFTATKDTVLTHDDTQEKLPVFFYTAHDEDIGDASTVDVQLSSLNNDSNAATHVSLQPATSV